MGKAEGMCPEWPSGTSLGPYSGDAQKAVSVAL